MRVRDVSTGNSQGAAARYCVLKERVRDVTYRVRDLCIAQQAEAQLTAEQAQRERERQRHLLQVTLPCLLSCVYRSAHGGD